MNIKSIQLTAIIMLTSLFLLPNFVMGAALPQDDPAMWDPANIETVVRLKITDNDPGGTYLVGGYSGLALMVETRKRGLVGYDYVERDLENHQFPTDVLWYANVVFAPYTNDDWCDLDPTGIAGVYQSQVSLKYAKHPDYGAITRNYNAADPDVRAGIRDGNTEGDRLKVSSFQEPINTGGDDRVISHQKWLRQSFFEWTLREPLTITALIARINQRKIVSESPLNRRCFPKYSRAGYTDRIELLRKSR